MRHPYEQYENTPVWRALDAEIAALEANADVALTTARSHVVGALCQRLDRARLLSPDATHPAERSRAQFAAFLERGASAGVPGSDWQAYAATHYADDAVEAARVEAVRLLLRQEVGGVSPAELAAGLAEIARRLRDRAV